jgi:para-nitrobenzyl esterase
LEFLGSQTAADLAVARYPLSDFDTPRQAFIALTSDQRFVCPARRVARAAHAGQPGQVYRYYFTYVPENMGPEEKADGAFHGIELFFLFDHFPFYDFTPVDRTVAEAIRGYWTRLAATSDPNDGTAPAWPVYDPASDDYLRIAAPPEPGQGIRTLQCDFWDSIR